MDRMTPHERRVESEVARKLGEPRRMVRDFGFHEVQELLPDPEFSEEHEALLEDVTRDMPSGKRRSVR